MYRNCGGEPSWHRAGVVAPLCKSTSISYLQISPQRREHIVSDTHQPSGRYATFQLTMALSKGGGHKVHHTSLTQFASLQAPASVSHTHRSLRGPQVSSTSAVLRQQMPPTGYPSCQTVGGRKQNRQVYHVQQHLKTQTTVSQTLTVGLLLAQGETLSKHYLQYAHENLVW